MDLSWLKTLAPMVGTALGGPLGGAAASFLADRLGIDSKTVEAVTEVLNSGKLSPEQITSIKTAELDFQKFLEQNKIDLAKLAVENTKDARDMQKLTRSHYPAVLSTFVTLGFFGILASMLFYDYRPTDSLLVMLGALGAAFGAVVNFWLGSSNGSAAKTELLGAR